MIDILGIIGAGYYNQNPDSNGILVYNDNSIVFGYKIPGIKFYTMNSNERTATYMKLRNIINQLEEFSKGEGCLYQLISQPNYDISDIKNESLNLNYIGGSEENPDKTFKVPPILFKKIIDKNIKDSFKLFEDYNYLTRDNYIFVRYYFNLNKRNIENRMDFIKDLFQISSVELEENVKYLNENIDTIVSTHNSKFQELSAHSLTLIEIVNVIRNYYGYSKLKHLPTQVTDENFLRTIFPGEIEFGADYIRTQEKININLNNKKLNEDKEKTLIVKAEELIARERVLIEQAGTSESNKMENDLNYIFIELFNIKIENVLAAPLKDKYYEIRNNIKNVLKVIKESDYKNLMYYNEEKLKLYLFIKTYYKNINEENNDTYLKVFSMNEIPSTLNMFHGDSLNSMYGDYTITLNFKKLPDSQTVIKMRRQIVIEKIKLDMPVMKWFLPIETLQEKIEMLRNVMREIDNSDFSRVEANCYITLRSHEEKDIRERDFGQYEAKTSLGWLKESDNAPFHILTNAMPSGLNKSGISFSRRIFLLNSTNVAQLSPLIAEERGAAKGFTVVAGYTSLIKLNLNEAPAGHLSIAGATGGGKSVLGNKLILDNKKAGDIVITTEKGNSFTRTTIFFGGKVYKPDMSGKIKINPFIFPLGAFEDEKIRKDIYGQMIASMSQMCNNYEPHMQQMYYKIIKRAFEDGNGNLNRKFVKNNAVTPTVLLNIMKVHPDFQKMPNILSSFEQYTSAGPYGSIFDGNDGLDLNYPLINIDYSGLQQGEIKDFVFKSLLQNIFNEMSKAQGKRRFFNLNDEFWDAIASSISSSDDTTKTAIGQIEAFFRVARKLGGKIGVISQGISDIANSPLKNAVLNNIYHSFFTRTPSANELKTIEELFKFEETQLFEIQNLSMEKGKYSEYFVSAPYGEKMAGSNINRDLRTKFRYFPTSLEIALFTTHPAEVDIYNYMYEIMGYTGDPSYTPQDIVMKAVRLFMDILPQGSDTNMYFQEKLYQNQQEYRKTFKYIVEEKYGSFENAFKTLTWDSYINS